MKDWLEKTTPSIPTLVLGLILVIGVFVWSCRPLRDDVEKISSGQYRRGTC